MTQDGKTRGEKSAVIVERLVRGQLRVMGCECFDIGIKRDTGEMILREGPARSRQPSSGYANENAKGGHIYVRPAGTHSLSLIDDLSAEAIERMKVEGFEPALVVETSPNNFQAWLNHGQVLEAPMSTRAAKALVERFDGDTSSADWRHFGRLAGFTNPKRERLLPSGMRPFARLRSATGRVYSRATEFLAGIRASGDGRQMRAEEPRKRGRRKGKVEVRALSEFHADPVYGGDLHRADMAWAKTCGRLRHDARTDQGRAARRPRPIEKGRPQASARWWASLTPAERSARQREQFWRWFPELDLESRRRVLTAISHRKRSEQQSKANGGKARLPGASSGRGGFF
jgi:RepB DNA-primase from phage plasmid